METDCCLHICPRAVSNMQIRPMLDSYLPLYGKSVILYFLCSSVFPNFLIFSTSMKKSSLHSHHNFCYFFSLLFSLCKLSPTSLYCLQPLKDLCYSFACFPLPPPHQFCCLLLRLRGFGRMDNIQFMQKYD